MRLIDADKLIEVFEEQDRYLWGLPDKENPHKRAKQGQLNWCINTVRDQPTVPHEPIKPTINEDGEAFCVCGENVGFIPSSKNLPKIRSKYCPECGRRMEWE